MKGSGKAFWAAALSGFSVLALMGTLVAMFEVKEVDVGSVLTLLSALVLFVLAELAWVDYIQEVIVWFKRSVPSELRQAVENEQVSEAIASALKTGEGYRSALIMAKALLSMLKSLAKG